VATTKRPTAQHERRRQIVAKGVVAGKQRAAIAAEAGVSTRQVHRITHEPATEFLIAEMMRPHRERLAHLADQALTSVERALKATVGKGKLKRPDYEIQLRAVGRLGELLEMAETESAEKRGAGVHSWEEFVLVYQRHKQEAAAAAA
jgi:hypothetical protein